KLQPPWPPLDPPSSGAEQTPLTQTPVAHGVPSAAGIERVQVAGSFAAAHRPSETQRRSGPSPNCWHSVPTAPHGTGPQRPPSSSLGSWLHCPDPSHTLHTSQRVPLAVKVHCP